MRFIIGTAAAIATLACVTHAGAQPAHVKTVANWLKTPSEEDLRGMWPAEAWKLQLGGKVRLDCEVDLQGLAQDCRVASEDPPGMGFGNAALSLTPKFLFHPATEDGVPVTSRTTFSIKFEGPSGRTSLGSRIPNSAVYGPQIGPTYFLIAHVPWAKAPSDKDVSAAYPKRANPDTPFGHVVLACQFDKTGDLTGCLTDAEEPTGQGFADAARSLTPLFHLDPADAGDLDLKRVKVNLAVHFIAPSHRQERRLIDHPDWLSAGSPGADLFPEKALRAGLITGRAELDCVANVAGRLTSCQVVSEDPGDMGFGAAALKTADAMAVNPWMTDGEPADGAHVVFAVRVNKDTPETAQK